MDIAKAFDISMDLLPRVIPAYDSPGRIKSDLAAQFGFKKEPPVVIGGNDAVLAAYSADSFQSFKAGANRKKEYLSGPVVMQCFLEKIV